MQTVPPVLFLKICIDWQNMFLSLNEYYFWVMHKYLKFKSRASVFLSKRPAIFVLSKYKTPKNIRQNSTRFMNILYYLHKTRDFYMPCDSEFWPCFLYMYDPQSTWECIKNKVKIRSQGIYKIFLLFYANNKYTHIFCYELQSVHTFSQKCRSVYFIERRVWRELNSFWKIVNISSIGKFPIPILQRMRRKYVM